MCEQYLLEVRKSSFISPRSQPDQYDADVYIHTSSLFVDVVKFGKAHEVVLKFI